MLPVKSRKMIPILYKSGKYVGFNRKRKALTIVPENENLLEISVHSESPVREN